MEPISSRRKSMFLRAIALTAAVGVCALAAPMPPATVGTGVYEAKEGSTDMTNADSSQNQAALAAVDEYIAAFNARDAERFARSLHYPHMRVDGLGRPSTWARWQDYAALVDFAEIVRRDRWDHTKIDWKRIVQSSPSKVHVAIAFTRFDAENRPLLSEESLYVVTRHDGRWAIQVRSSFLERTSQAVQQR